MVVQFENVFTNLCPKKFAINFISIKKNTIFFNKMSLGKNTNQNVEDAVVESEMVDEIKHWVNSKITQPLSIRTLPTSEKQIGYTCSSKLVFSLIPRSLISQTSNSIC